MWHCPQTKDHPRLCGEKGLRIQNCLYQSGSPPPMRGKVERVYFAPQDLRITPAYAGKSVGIDTGQKCIQDHPRLCGEKSSASTSDYNFVGSPPPMRGKVFAFIPKVLLKRITPAYAGKSSSRSICSRLSRDHPRLCGEKLKHQQTIEQCTGSPPPMRGKVKKIR